MGHNLMGLDIGDCLLCPSASCTMPPKQLHKLTTDEVALLVIAARLVEIIKAHAELSLLSNEVQVFWNRKIGLDEWCVACSSVN
jgi:hypothetical protein